MFAAPPSTILPAAFTTVALALSFSIFVEERATGIVLWALAVVVSPLFAGWFAVKPVNSVLFPVAILVGQLLVWVIWGIPFDVAPGVFILASSALYGAIACAAYLAAWAVRRVLARPRTGPR